MDALRIALVQDRPNAVSETFIRAHAERLPGVVAVFHSQKGLPAVDGRAVVTPGWWARAGGRLTARLRRRDSPGAPDRAWEIAIAGVAANVTLAEYGTTGTLVDGACQRVNAPLVVHFHGFDASITEIIERKAAEYRRMFGRAAAVIAVSRAMERQLLRLGCPREKLIYNPCGVDCARFAGADPASANPHFVAVGRMVEKKAPHLTLASFARVVAECPTARLRLIGDGVLLGVCRDLAAALGIDHAVTFLGAQPHEIVAQEMRQARALVQHSVTASNGDSEGTPVAVLEAGAMGLPVVSTRHAGIPDVVADGITGFLVDERDVQEMARHMLTLVRNPVLSSQTGRNAAAHVRRYFTVEQSIGRLARILRAAAHRQDMAAVRASIDTELPVALPIATTGASAQKALQAITLAGR
jgi:colanic acid/amylovoran biosynthesis glycosyltransferase